jgi:hypothetical protein
VTFGRCKTEPGAGSLNFFLSEKQIIELDFDCSNLIQDARIG